MTKTDNNSKTIKGFKIQLQIDGEQITLI